MKAGTAKAWFLLFRPWSYAATVVPFCAGFALARGPHFSPWRWWTGFAAALSIQAACNLLNTWGDGRSGVDDVEGAICTTPQVRDGFATLGQVLAAAVGCLAFTAVLGIPLLFFRDAAGAVRFNFLLAAIAAAGFLGATNYTTGVRFKYRGLGVPFVFVLMGPLEIAGVIAASAPAAPFPDAWRLLLLSLPAGCLVSVIMHGNDMRDIPSDRLAGIRTPATILGPSGALALYAALHLVPYACIAVRAVCGAGPRALIPLLALPLSARTLARAFVTWRGCRASPPWRGLERASGAIHLAFGVLYAASL